KQDVGSPSEQEDEGDRTKAAFSDALKRAAVHFGVFRYGYRLPSQWCDCTTVERGGRQYFKAWVQQPKLPPWALPRWAQKVSVQQEAELLNLISRTRSDLTKFCQHFGIKALADLPTNRFAEAVGMLQAKAAANSKPAPKDSSLVKTLQASIGAKRAEAAAG